MDGIEAERIAARNGVAKGGPKIKDVSGQNHLDGGGETRLETENLEVPVALPRNSTRSTRRERLTNRSLRHEKRKRRRSGQRRTWQTDLGNKGFVDP